MKTPKRSEKRNVENNIVRVTIFFYAVLADAKVQKNIIIKDLNLKFFEGKKKNVEFLACMYVFLYLCIDRNEDDTANISRRLHKGWHE